jgi:poly(3-hydroxybutyrate) depolymerase
MYEVDRAQFPALAFLWPALAAESASEFASAVARELVSLAMGSETQAKGPEPQWTTRNEVALELGSVRLRDFSESRDGIATLICAPFALHSATITDLAVDHSLVAALRGAGLGRLFVTDWRSASPDMRFLSIDSYLADLNVVVDQIGGAVNLIGLCQGGWMALVYAARFPAKVRKLVLAGAPIDIAAGDSRLSALARNVPMSVFKELVDLGNGRILGRHALRFWEPNSFDRDTIHPLLQATEPIGSPAFEQLERRFLDWYAATVDLPGAYYLEVVERLFKENQLAEGRFQALGRQADLANVHCPLFLLAARDDEVVAPEQVFATERLIDTKRCSVRKAVAPCGHLGLFMGKAILSRTWPDVARWVRAPGRRSPVARAARARG